MSLYTNIIELFKTEQPQVQNAAKPSVGRVAKELLDYSQSDRFKIHIGTWREALSAAETEGDWDRSLLYSIYKEIEDDSQVTANKNTRVFAVTLNDFSIKDSKGEYSEELTATFDSFWFFQFLENIMDSIFYGYSLSELTIEEGKVTDVFKFWEQNTAPEYAAIKKDSTGGITQSNLVSLEGSVYEPRLIEVFKNRHDLGLFNKLAPYFIWKKVFGSWSEHADRFGIPFRYVKTDLRDDERVNNARKMLANMVTSTWAVMGEDDEFVLSQEPGRDGYRIYEKLIEKCDQAISKILLGQTGTTDEKAFSGSADVHKAILDNYVKADKKFVAHIVNSVLMPKLVDLGIVAEGTSFVWDSIDSITLSEKVAAIVQLSTVFDVDVEFASKWTKIPLTLKETPLESSLTNTITGASFSIPSAPLDDFEAGSFRKRKIAEGVSVLIGNNTATNLPAPQAYYFESSVFSQSSAEEWLQKNKK